jgi:hypothetical protein
MERRFKGCVILSVVAAVVAVSLAAWGQALELRAYPGGHLKFTYEATFGHLGSAAKTTVEILPQPDGRYEVRTSGDQFVTADHVRVGFFGLGWVGMGFRVRDTAQGGIDLSGLSALDQQTLVPGKTYLLPDGGTFQAGDADRIAGIDVIHGVYTHEDAARYKVEMAWATSAEVRNLLPSPPYLKLLERKTADGAFDTVVTEICLTEFVR